MASPTHGTGNGDNTDQVDINVRAGDDAIDREVRDDRLMAFMEVKFEEMREESDGLKRKLKKQDETRQVKFAKKGHEVQHEFNTEILEAIETIQDGVERQRTTRVKKLLDDLAKKV